MVSWKAPVAAMAAVLLTCILGGAEEPVPPAPEPEAQPVPTTDVGKTIFMNPAAVTTTDPKKVAICPTCGKPMWMHAEPGFECIPMGREVRKVDYLAAVCPVCGKKFAGPAPSGMSADTEVDSDFCRHSAGRADVVSRVWMCPGCGYAAWCDSFNDGVPGEVKKYTRETISAETLEGLRSLVNIPKLKLEDMSFLEQQDIPDALKYSNALRLATQFGRDDLELARLALEASHACRRAVNDRISALFLSPNIRLVDLLMATSDGNVPEVGERVKRLEGALAAGKIDKYDMDEATEFCVDITLAGLYDRLGDTAQARACLDSAAALVPKVKVQREFQRGVVKEVADTRQRRLGEERKYRRKALDLYRELQEKGKLKGPDVLGAGYLVADLYRREGEPGKAKAWVLGLLSVSEKVDPFLRVKMADMLDLPGMRTAAVDAVEAGLAAAAAEKLGAAAGAGETVPPTQATGTMPENTAAGGAEPAAVGAAPGRAPADCREVMRNFYAAASAYREKHKGEWPATKEELVAEGYLTAVSVNDWQCPASRETLLYRRPPGDEKTFIFYHRSPGKCACKLVLWSDGSITALGE
ncbi:MAG: DUF2225 domain-containing protein [Planctomycetes bacterium]|nr:DUF2225 domain-containing protein [Planctomycetota bacterium]